MLKVPHANKEPLFFKSVQQYDALMGRSVMFLNMVSQIPNSLTKMVY